MFPGVPDRYTPEWPSERKDTAVEYCRLSGIGMELENFSGGDSDGSSEDPCACS